MKNNSNSKYLILIAILPCMFLGTFYFYPLIKIFQISFMPDGAWELDKITKIFTTSYYANTLWFTFWQAIVSTFLTLIFALPGAYVFAKYNFMGKNILQSLTAVPFVLPTVVVAAAFQALLGTNGLVNTCFMQIFGYQEPLIQINQTIWFILIAHVFYNYTVVFRIVGGFWVSLEQNLDEAAQMLGANKWQIFWKITFPLLIPAIITAGLLVFIFCFSSFGVILILGGPRFSTIEVEIYNQTINFFNLPVAGALSIIQILFTFILIWVYSLLQRKASVALNPEYGLKIVQKVKTLKDKIIVSINVFFILAFLVGPLVALLISSFTTENGFSFIFYKTLLENTSQSIFFVPPIKGIFFSLGFAFITMIFAVILGLLGSLFISGSKNFITSLIDPIFMLPLSTSAVTLGFGFILALDKPPLNLRTSIFIVPLAHTLVAFPFVLRSILPAIRSIPKTLKEAATLLGASPKQVWLSVDLPIIGRALIVGAIFGFTISLGEFGATAFVARPNTPTIPLAIYRFFSQPGMMNYGQAMAMSSLLMIVTVVGFLFLDRLRLTGSREF